MLAHDDALAAISHALRRGGTPRSVHVARRYREQAVRALEARVQVELSRLGHAAIVPAREFVDASRRGSARWRSLRCNLDALEALRPDARTDTFRGCALLVAGRPSSALTWLSKANARTRGAELLAAIEMTTAACFHRLGDLQGCYELQRAAARRRTSLQTTATVLAAFMAVRIERLADAARLLEEADDTGEGRLAEAVSEVEPLIRATGRRDPQALVALQRGLERVDPRGTWLEVVQNVS